MFREELRTKLYNQTGEWFTDDELDDYMVYRIQDNIYSNNNTTNDIDNKAININPLLQFDEGGSLLNDNIINEVNNLFTMVLKKAKSTLESKSEKMKFHQQLDELGYFTKIFICKCLLYIILQNGKEKGYKWRDL